jgi:transcriptional regulator with PAS, ATPase and Fis domain
VFVDPLSRRIAEQINRFATSKNAVLVRGECGTGKDLAAALLHYLGSYSDEPMLKVDCASLPHELLESELFGECRTGCESSPAKRGRFELAGNGTLILDEVAALTMPLQARLLKIIEHRELERLGGGNPIRVPARIVALTSVDLERAVARHSFREDLYYRLSVSMIAIPPLRERKDDIQPLADYFLAQLSQVHRRPKPVLTAEALRALRQFSYPGNVRQLRSILERVIMLVPRAEIREEDLPAYVRPSTGRPMMSLEELERSYIAEILDATQGRKSKAAAILGISRKTLLEKRKRYGLD